jgi:hypothetical protein
MKVNPEVLSSIERFLELAHEAADELWQEADFFMTTQGQRKYVIVSAGVFHFRVDGETGEIRCFPAGRYRHRPNIRDYVKREDWLSGNISVSSACVPILVNVKCAVCGRTESVARTKLGRRCRYCRSSDTRRINSIRRFGGTPMLNGRPLCGDLYED